MSTDVYRKCVKCGANAAQDGSIRFHRFPKPGTTNILRATTWATYCWPDQDWSSVKSLTSLYETNKVLCGRHFQDSCYTDNRKKRLRRYAVPGTKQYVIDALHSLRSKISISSIVQQVKPSQDLTIAGCSTDPVCQSTWTVEPSQDPSVAVCLYKLDHIVLHTFPNPEKEADRFRTWLDINPKLCVFLNNKLCMCLRRLSF